MTDEEVAEALNAVLKPLGSHLRHYTAANRSEAIRIMRKILKAKDPGSGGDPGPHNAGKRRLTQQRRI